jgi:hypothetical protein
MHKGTEKKTETNSPYMFYWVCNIGYTNHYAPPEENAVVVVDVAVVVVVVVVCPAQEKTTGPKRSHKMLRLRKNGPIHKLLHIFF